MTENAIKKTMSISGISFLIFYCLTALVWMLVISFSRRIDLALIAPANITLKNYIDIITNPNLHFIDYLKNSIIISLITAFSTTLLMSITAYAFSRLPIKKKEIILIVVIAVAMFPQICIVGYLYKFMSSLRLINTYVSLVLPYIAWCMPICLWILLSYFSQIPADLDRAALIDGASQLQVLTKILLPLSLPGLIAAFLIIFLFSYNELLFALMLTTDYKTRTLPVGIAMFQGLHGEIPWGTIMAASTIAALPVIFIVLIFQRYIVHGLTRGAVK